MRGHSGQSITSLVEPKLIIYVKTFGYTDGKTVQKRRWNYLLLRSGKTSSGSGTTRGAPGEDWKGAVTNDRENTPDVAQTRGAYPTRLFSTVPRILCRFCRKSRPPSANLVLRTPQLVLVYRFRPLCRPPRPTSL